MSPIMLVVAILGGALGGLSTLYLVISLIGVVVWKFYRRIFKGIPLTK